MYWIILTMAVIPLVVGILLLWLVWKVKRHGIGDRPSELNLYLYLTAVTVYAAAVGIWGERVPGWLAVVTIVVAVVPSLALVVVRCPEMLFTPKIAARIRAARARIRSRM